MLTIEGIIWYIILLDSLVCNFIAWLDERWYIKNFKTFSRLFPITKAFAAYYFVLVLWIGLALYRLDVLF